MSCSRRHQTCILSCDDGFTQHLSLIHVTVMNGLMLLNTSQFSKQKSRFYPAAEQEYNPTLMQMSFFLKQKDHSSVLMAGGRRRLGAAQCPQLLYLLIPSHVNLLSRDLLSAAGWWPAGLLCS